MKAWDEWIKKSTNNEGLADVAFLDPQDPRASKGKTEPSGLATTAFVDPQNPKYSKQAQAQAKAQREKNKMLGF